MYGMACVDLYSVQICTKRSEDLLVYNIIADTTPIDTDGAITSASTSPSSSVSTAATAVRIGMMHIASLNALGYVQGGKKQKKWMSVSPTHGHAAIIDYARYCYIYVKPVRTSPSAPQYVLQLPYTVTAAPPVAPSSSSEPTPTPTPTTIRMGHSDTVYGMKWVTRMNAATSTRYDVLCILTDDAIIEVPFII
jgi:hypothetical protein